MCPDNCCRRMPIAWISHDQSIDNEILSSRKKLSPIGLKIAKDVCINMGMYTIFAKILIFFNETEFFQ